MAYAQWINVVVEPINFQASIKNAHLAWGKFYQEGNKDKEISSDEINKITIASDGVGKIYSCGRSDSASGTEGSFDVFDGDTHVGTFYWNCPWGSKSNTFFWTSMSNRNYITQVEGGNPDSGAIGRVELTIYKK